MVVKILSLRGMVFEGDAKSANLKTLSGEITILDHHRPIVSLLTKGEAKIKKNDGKEERIHINSGFLEMSSENVLTLLVD